MKIVFDSDDIIEILRNRAAQIMDCPVMLDDKHVYLTSITFSPCAISPSKEDEDGTASNNVAG